VRQLENVIRRIVVLHDGETVTPDMLPPLVAGDAASQARPDPSHAASQGHPASVATAIRPFREQEREIVEAALAAFSGNVSRAAAALQISPATIYRKLQNWGISPP
jgi:two-component system repressor protein LuxO